MGVTELFHFRRFLRRGRRVANGSRHFVIGLDKTTSNDDNSSAPTGVLPKGNHFIVAFNRGTQLSEQEMDICNNNERGANNSLEVTSESTRGRAGDRTRTVSFGTYMETTVFTMMPGASVSTALGEHDPGGSNTSKSPTSAVISTTDL